MVCDPRASVAARALHQRAAGSTAPHATRGGAFLRGGRAALGQARAPGAGARARGAERGVAGAGLGYYLALIRVGTGLSTARGARAGRVQPAGGGGAVRHRAGRPARRAERAVHRHRLQRLLPRARPRRRQPSRAPGVQRGPVCARDRAAHAGRPAGALPLTPSVIATA